MCLRLCVCMYVCVQNLGYNSNWLMLENSELNKRTVLGITSIELVTGRLLEGSLKSCRVKKNICLCVLMFKSFFNPNF